ncbi:MAG: ABC transporter ATP-binding protein, partial [Chloroflexi bacterium]|nr:ABC transporter ATP-binding protein [Chloroflexota bacterium]
IGGFSRGMRQRLGLAQALLHRPPVLLLDEPVSALDPAGRREILELIESLRGEATVFMSTHILADVERACDTVGIINRGRLVVQAGREELLARYAAPILEVRFEAAGEQVGAWVGALAGRGDAGAVGVRVDGSTARITVRDPARAKVELPAAVAAAGLPVQKYEWVRPSLEEVFLRLVEA